MKERDPLKLAARALYQESDGRRTDSGLTRARIMNSVHGHKRRRAHLWSFAIPGLLLLVGGSAFAQATHSWPAVWQQVASVLGVELAADVPSVPPTSDTNVSETQETRKSQRVPPLLPPEPAPLEPAPPEPAPLELPQVNIATPAAPPTKPATEQIPAPSSEPEEPRTPPEPNPDPELAAFRRAHRLHFEEQNPTAAIAAYNDYIAGYPGGRFVPEAKYNIGINLLRSGRKAEARAALEPFAAGRHRGYRQAEARALLDAL